MLQYSDAYTQTHRARLTQVIGQEWDVVLDILAPDQVEPRFLHAVVSNWFDLADDQRPRHSAPEGPTWVPGLASPSGHLAPSKPYAVGPLWQRPDGRSGFSLRLLGGTIHAPAGPQMIRLGRQDAIVDWPSSSMLTERTVGCFQQLPTVSSVLVRFETPVTRRQGDAYHPVPTEQSILTSWERTAAMLGLDGATDWSTAGARITHLNGYTASWPAPKARSRRRDPVGFVGEIAIAAPISHGRRLHQLAALAGFGGTGSHTAFGMGCTTLMASEEAS